MGYVNGQWRTANCGDPYYPYILDSENVKVISCAPQFIANGQAMDLVYTVKNIGELDETYRFNIWADTMVDMDDGSLNSINDDRSVLTMTSNTGISFFGLSMPGSGIQFVRAYYWDSNPGYDPLTYTEVPVTSDSAMFAYWPEATLAAGAQTEYHFLVGMADADSLNDILNGIFDTPATATYDMFTVNIDGTLLVSWRDILNSAFNLSNDELLEVNEANGDLLHVNIVGKQDKTIPASVVHTVNKSKVGGLHVFIGDSDAVTFFNKYDFSKYSDTNFEHNDTIADNVRTIDFTNKVSLDSNVVLHSLITPDTKAVIYKVVNGEEIEIDRATSNCWGGICFDINELATYVIRY